MIIRMNINEDDEDKDHNDDDGYDVDGEMETRIMIPGNLLGSNKNSIGMIIIKVSSIHWKFYNYFLIR